MVDRDDDMVRSGVTLSEWIRSVIKALARWAAERRGREDMTAGVEVWSILCSRVLEKDGVIERSIV